MINIVINNDRIASGDAWEEVYINKFNEDSYSIITSPPFIRGKSDEVSLKYSYELKTDIGTEIIYLDKFGVITIPNRYLVNNLVWKLSFMVTDIEDGLVIFRSDPFCLKCKLTDKIINKREREVPDAKNAISVETMDDLHRIPRKYLTNGKIIRVNNFMDGRPRYFIYDSRTGTFKKENFDFDGVKFIDLTERDKDFSVFNNREDYDFVDLTERENESTEDFVNVSDQINEPIVYDNTEDDYEFVNLTNLSSDDEDNSSIDSE